jgi:predicted nucleotidyltransferase
MEVPIHIGKDQIADFRRKHHLTKLALFGSMLTDRFGAESDVDVLFEYDLDNVPTLLHMVQKERELSEIVGRKAQMRSPDALCHYFREQVVSAAVVQYAAHPICRRETMLSRAGHVEKAPRIS